MNPLRWEVLALGFVLALPVLALGFRGDLSAEEVTTRLPWCLLAAWAVVVLLRAATTPPPSAKKSGRRPVRAAADAAPDTDDAPPP